MKKIFSKEVIIGLIVAVAFVLLFIGINFLKGINLFHEANYYYVSYENVAGLAQSAPVHVNGFKVGLVREIEYEYDNPGHVLVEISLDKQLRVPEGTVAVLTADILGTATISLEMPRPDGKFIEVGDRIPGKTAEGLMDQVASDLMPSVASIFPKVDTLLTNINLLVSNPALSASITRLDAITADLERATAGINALLASLPPVVNDVKGITSNVNHMSEDLTVVSAKLREVPVDSLVANLQATTDNLRELSNQLRDPNSSLGLLMNDPSLYRNIDHTVKSLDSLFIDIKKNPKRYINIKVF